MLIDIHYILQVLSASAIFTAFFYLAMRPSTFFRLNRIYLLGTFLGAVLIPLIRIPSFIPVETPTLMVMLDEVVVGEAVIESALGINWYLVAYFVISLLLLVRILLGFRVADRILKRSEKQNINGLEVYVSDEDINPFSFFKRILINRELLSSESELAPILKHESTHVRQGHSYDVLLTELICSLFWFNPFFWLLKKEIKSTHEYLADENVLEQDLDLANYFLLIFNNLLGRNVGLTNNFNHSLNFKRMKMMKKKRSSRFARVLNSFLIPVVVVGSILLTSQCTKQEGNTIPANEKVFMVVEEMPKFEGGDAELLNYLRKNVKYPSEAQENGIQGRVYVEFVVDKQGQICDVKILKGVSSVLDAEALRVVKSMPNWNPGKQRGQLVNVSYRLPINFTLR